LLIFVRTLRGNAAQPSVLFGKDLYVDRPHQTAIRGHESGMQIKIDNLRDIGWVTAANLMA
jgi:hypothetical protein